MVGVSHTYRRWVSFVARPDSQVCSQGCRLKASYQWRLTWTARQVKNIKNGEPGWENLKYESLWSANKAVGSLFGSPDRWSAGSVVGK